MHETLPHLINLVNVCVVDRLDDLINFLWSDSMFSPEIVRNYVLLKGFKIMSCTRRPVVEIDIQEGRTELFKKTKIIQDFLPGLSLNVDNHVGDSMHPAREQVSTACFTLFQSKRLFR